jgi:N-acetylglutamate synthase-like GNAT family acetyltransferase
MNIKIEYLADNTNLIPDIALLNYKNWGYFTPERTYSDLCLRMTKRVNKECQPLHIVAKINNKAVGGAILKINKMEEYPDLKNWIGSVAVNDNYKGNGIASLLVLEICKIAKSKSIKHIYLQTEMLNGGLYKKLGFTPLKRVISLGDNILIMVKKL